MRRMLPMAFIIKDRTGSKMHRVLDRLASRIFLQLAGIALCLCCQTVCLAGTTNELAVDMLEPGRPAPPGSPPPPGSGDIAPLLTEGDALARLAPPPTGRAGDAATTRFRRDVLSPRSA